MVKYGNLVAVGQRDIENFNNIRNLIRQHLENTEKNRKFSTPVSIAVFGAPGNGKSFAITEIAEDLGSNFEVRTYNLSEFESRSDLEQAFVEIASISAQKKIPLVFFDEFDSSRNDKPFGWLKYFLAPMQDGTFRHNDGKIVIGGAILIFAGGICESFSEFRDKAEEVVRKSDLPSSDRWSPKDVKMPDFVSRLKGHIDIPGYNRIPRVELAKERSWQGAEDHYTPYVRRGLLLNSILDRKEMMANEVTGESGVHRSAQIDEDLLRALLTVSRYRHGARSMEAVVSIMMPLGQKMEKSGLPLISQLNMHVPGSEFWLRTVYPHAVWPVETFALIPCHGRFQVDRDAKRWVKDLEFSSPESFVPVSLKLLSSEFQRMLGHLKRGGEGAIELNWLSEWLERRRPFLLSLLMEQNGARRPNRRVRRITSLSGKSRYGVEGKRVVSELVTCFRSLIEQSVREECWASGGLVREEDGHWCLETKDYGSCYPAFAVREVNTMPVLIPKANQQGEERLPVFLSDVDRYMEPRRAVFEIRNTIRSMIRTMVECEWRSSA